MLTHPNVLAPAIKDESCEILFEMFGFGEVFKSSSKFIYHPLPITFALSLP